MSTLERHELDFERTIDYIKYNLSGGTTLSSELMGLNFNEGRFFTLLPSNSNLERIYEFIDGVVIPQNPEVEYESDSGKNSTYCVLPTLEKELACFVLQHLENNKNLSCIFDDVLRYSTDPEDDLIKKYNLSYSFGREVYYLIKSGFFNYDAVLKCIEESNVIWHSLGVLAEVNFDSIKNNKLTLENLKAFCFNVKIFIVGAYDGEGYIFWEKK